jgi:hypothetical protein
MFHNPKTQLFTFYNLTNIRDVSINVKEGDWPGVKCFFDTDVPDGQQKHPFLILSMNKNNIFITYENYNVRWFKRSFQFNDCFLSLSISIPDGGFL